MIPCQSILQAAVPRTLEKRLEVMRTLRALAEQYEDERVGCRRAEIASPRRELNERVSAIDEPGREYDSRLRSYVNRQ